MIWARCLVFCVTLLVLDACATTNVLPDVRFRNETLGIASDFSSDWVIATDRESAPPPIKEHFPPNKAPDDSPLLFGIRSTGDAFARVLVEPVPSAWTAEEYFKYLHRVLGAQLEVFEVGAAPRHEAVRWKYRDVNVQVNLTFVETIAVRNGYGVRVGYWTLTSLLPLYEEEFDRLTEAWLFRNEAGAAWKNHWAGLTGGLTATDLGFVTLADPPGGGASCPEGQRQKMWDVVGPEGRVHLFGSIHLGQPSDYPLPDEIDSAFERSRNLIVEIDVTAPSVQRQMQELMQEYGSLPPGESIEDKISHGAYAKLASTFEGLGLPIDRFHTMKPWSLATVVTVFKFQSLGYLPAYGVDKHFLDRAGDREILSIETPGDQIRLLSSLDGELFLGFTLLEMEVLEHYAEEMMQSWRCGDEEQLEYFFIDSAGVGFPGSDRLMEKMYYERNERMADFAAAQLDLPGEHFLVVGIAHLVGDRGVPALLRERGYKVETR